MRLIDADALGMYLNYWRYGDFSDIKHEREYAVLSDVIEAVHHAPTVDAVERRRGEWVDNGLDSIGFMGIEYRLQKCSNCGETIAKAPMQRLPNFCSNCGADMRGENNGNNVRE